MPRLFKDVNDGEVVVLDNGLQVQKVLEDGGKHNAVKHLNTNVVFIIPDDEVTYTVDEFWENSKPVTDPFDV